MVGAITAVGYWRTNPVLALHQDEIAGIGEIYQVFNLSPPNQLPAQRPLINDFGRIEGRVTSDSFPSTFGLNVFPLPVIGPQVPSVGKFAGTARLPTVGGVVGRSDTSTGAPSSGEFRIHGVPAAVAYNLRTEPSESLGFNVTPNPAGGLTWSEWIHDPNFNPQNNLPWGVLTEGPLAVTVLSRFAHGANSRGTLYVAPGTVIELTVVMEQVSPSVEPVTRPVVELDRRTGRPIPFAGAAITATVTHDYELNFPGAAWQVIGGATTAAGTPATTTQPANPVGFTGPWVTTWTATLSNLIPPTGPVTLQFRCQEFPYRPGPGGGPHRPPQGITPIVGINEVRF
jgi:hypothetical protein